MMIEYDGAFGSSNSHLALNISTLIGHPSACVFGSRADTLQLPVARKMDT